MLNGATYRAAVRSCCADFAPVAMIVTGPMLIVSRKRPCRPTTCKELIAWLKANPDKATAGTGGVGSPAHISGIFFQKMTGTQFQFVPYRGTAPAMRDLVAGQIDIMIDQASNVAAAAARRHDQGLRGHEPRAPAVGARRADRRRGRPARPPYLGMARRCGRRGHAGATSSPS